MRALICGVSGQDGAYLAQALLGRGYEVIGSSRDAMATQFSNLEALGIAHAVRRTSMAVNDFRSVLHTLEAFEPDEVYNLAGQSSVGLSFEQPVETMDSIVGGTLNLLEAIRFTRRPIRFYNAGSAECFGDTGTEAADEASPFHPRSPYAVAKTSSYWLVRNYREAYGVFACTGILFNHESPLRPERFVTQKIVRTAARIARGSRERLELGNIAIQRDWGWAPEYVAAMHAMLARDEPDDYVIGTGRATSLEHFVARAFEWFSLDWSEHVDVNEDLYRPADIMANRAQPAKAARSLGWRAEATVEDVIDRMCAATQQR